MDFKAYGKINLSLDITGVLPNGYHSVSMVMQSVELCDIVSIDKRNDKKITVLCDNPQVPSDNKNLAYKACELMINEFDIPHGFDIKILKNIPIAGGMAGGSTDAAAVFRGINQMCDINADIKKLMELGVTLGADIPFCIQIKPALAEGIGEKLSAVSGLKKELYILLVNPNILVSTKEIYSRIDANKTYNILNNQSLISALDSGNLDEMRVNMKNVMEEVTNEVCPEISNIINKLYNNGAEIAVMSGSGATCYGVFKDLKKALEAQNAFSGFFTAITNPIE